MFNFIKPFIQIWIIWILSWFHYNYLEWSGRLSLVFLGRVFPRIVRGVAWPCLLHGELSSWSWSHLSSPELTLHMSYNRSNTQRDLTPDVSYNIVGFPNWHVSGCQLGEETPLHSPIWLWRLLEPSNLVAPPKKYTFRIGTCIESIFAVDSSFTSAVVAEL